MSERMKYVVLQTPQLLGDKITVEKGQGLYLSLLLCFTDTTCSCLTVFFEGGEPNAEKPQIELKYTI